MDAAHVFSSPKNSIWYLGLIAFSKMLSPSHSQDSISLFTRYKSFLKITAETEDPSALASKQLLKHNFLGFSSNRFGRIPELSNIFVDHKDTIGQFYDEQIDENQNKLWLACFSYLNSAWFKLCCEIGSFFFHEVIKPHKLALGIDEGRFEKSEHRSWSGMKQFYSQLLEKLGNISVRRPDMSGKDLLKAKVAGNIAGAISHQLGYMKYFNEEEDDLSPDILEKLDSAPLTNDGCESHFAHLDQDCRRSGGQTKLETLSNRHISKMNKYFESDEWLAMSDELRKNKWKDARSSEASKKVLKMKKEFFAKVEASKKIANEEKKKKKQMKNMRTIKLLAVCKAQGGPLVPEDLDSGFLDNKSEQEILNEVRYLRATIAPNIREKIKDRETKKFIKLTKAEMIDQISNVLKPKSDISEFELIENLLKENLALETGTDTSIVVTESSSLELGTVGLFKNDADLKSLGVVLDSSSLQLYEPCRYGFSCNDGTEKLSDWSLVKEILDFDFIKKRGNVYLCCKVSKDELAA